MSEDTGTYICRAYNQFGVPASAQITLQLSGKFKNRINDNAIVYMYVYVTAYKNNNIMLINLLILGGGGGSGGMLPQEKFNISTSETVSGGFWDLAFSVVCPWYPLVPLHF